MASGSNVILLLLLVCRCSCRPDNIILILTDDQDVTETGYIPLPKTSYLIGEHGVTFTNAFATTPVCCPSRSSILTGLYPHNHGTRNNSVSGGCSSPEWETTMESNSTFAVHLKNQGYTTFYAGKYLNQYGKKKSAAPAGWDWWLGLVGNSRYYNYSLSVNGTVEEHGDAPSDYLTDVISDRAEEFLTQPARREEPFLMVLATPACHDPFTPAERYRDRFTHVTAPKGPDFNAHSQGKHWLLQMLPHSFSPNTIARVDEIYRDRLKTLISVDDMVERLVLKLKALKLLERTHLIFTSDHGFHMGQFGMPWDKRLPYDFDLRVPLTWRGPGVPENATVAQPALLLDLAPTLMRIGGVPDAPTDGVPLQSLLARQNVERTFLVEYSGESHPDTVADECHLDKDQFFECRLENECKCQDSRNNTYTCLRHLSTSCNVLFCQFQDDQHFEEAYDMRTDPLQLNNVVQMLSPSLRRHYRKTMESLKSCRGLECTSRIRVSCPE